MVLFWTPVFVNAWVTRAQAEQALGLKLAGTAVGDDPSRNFAIIENQSTGNQRAYREGDRLGEAVIKNTVRAGGLRYQDG